MMSVKSPFLSLLFLVTFVPLASAGIGECEALFGFPAGNSISIAAKRDIVRFERSWSENARSDIALNWRYLENAIAARDPQIIFLEKLGFNLSPGRLKIPTARQAFAEIAKQVDALVSSGQIDASEAIYPARVFSKTVDGKKDFRPIRLGEEPPEGFAPDDLLLGVDFAKFVEKGFYPIGEPHFRSAESNLSLLFHDLGHFGSMIEKPKYMAAIRNSYRHFAGHPEYFQDYRFEKRLNFILESSVMIHPAFRNQVLDTFKSLGVFIADSEHQTSLVYRYGFLLDDKSDQQMLEIAKTLSSHFVQWIDNTGGLQRDITARMIDRERTDGGYRYLRSNLRSRLDLILDTSWTGDRLRSKLAELLAAIDYSSRIAPEDWLLAVSHGRRLNLESTLYEFLCKSGAGPGYAVGLFCD